MSSISAVPGATPASSRPAIDHPSDKATHYGVLAVGALGLAFAAFSVWRDVDVSGGQTHSILVYLLLAVALVIALGFEFVNGFHDTANAVATVIYTHSLEPHTTRWSGRGCGTFLGVLTSSGAVAFGDHLAVAGRTDPAGRLTAPASRWCSALLIAAIIWNLGTWWLGLPASSSHTLIGSIIGVGVANAMLSGRNGTSGVDWDQAMSIGKALLISPVVGFVFSGLLLLVMKFLVRKPELYAEPKPNTVPPLWIRALLIFTCTGVSFAHGSNDGQKGMGLIMLILIGTVPTAYALNRAVPDSFIPQFEQASDAASKIVDGKAAGYAITGDPRPAVIGFVRDKKLEDGVYPSLAALMRDISAQVKGYGSLANVPPEPRQQHPQRHVPRLRSAAHAAEGPGQPALRATTPRPCRSTRPPSTPRPSSSPPGSRSWWRWRSASAR